MQNVNIRNGNLQQGHNNVDIRILRWYANHWHKNESEKLGDKTGRWPIRQFVCLKEKLLPCLWPSCCCWPADLYFTACNSDRWTRNKFRNKLFPSVWECFCNITFPRTNKQPLLFETNLWYLSSPTTDVKLLRVKWSYFYNRPWRLIGLSDVLDPTFPAPDHRWLWCCQPYAPTALCRSGRFLILIFVRGWVDFRAIMPLEELGQ
jgi:hypothetical protein